MKRHATRSRNFFLGPRGLSLALLVAAFAPRVHELASQPLSYAEGVGLYYTIWPLPVMIAFAATGEHGPLHALLLAGWTALAGRSELAVRFLSVWPSVLTVALSLVVVRRLLRTRGATKGRHEGLAVTSASHRGKNGAGLERPAPSAGRLGRVRAAIAYACALFVALVPGQWRIAQEAVPYAWATMWLVLAAFLLIRWMRSRGDRMLIGAFAVACIAAVYTDPLAWLVIGGFWLVALIYSVWVGEWAPWQVVTTVVLAALVAFMPWALAATRWWQAPLLSIQARSGTPVMAVVSELDALFGRRVGLIVPDRPDFRAVVDAMAHRAMPNEAAILVGGHGYPMFDYYARGRWATYPLPARLAPADPQPLDEAQVAARLDRMVDDGHRVVWLVLWQAEATDPNGLTRALLSAKGRPMDVDEQFRGVEVLRFELPKGTVFSGD